MTLGAADIVAPVFTTPKVVALFFARVTGKTGFGDLFWCLVFERDDLCRVAFFRVSLSWAMASFAAGYLVLPAVDTREARVRSVREGFELVFVAGIAGVAAGVVVVR